MSKYRGVWTPDMGFGDEPEEPRSSPSPSARAPRYYSEQFNAAREREEKIARLEAWMNGREPRWMWDVYGTWKVFIMTFPGTVHELVFVAEHPTEHGRVMQWCESCSRDDCGACRFAKSAYLAERRRDNIALGFAADGTSLPF